MSACTAVSLNYYRARHDYIQSRENCCISMNGYISAWHNADVSPPQKQAMHLMLHIHHNHHDHHHHNQLNRGVASSVGYGTLNSKYCTYVRYFSILSSAAHEKEKLRPWSHTASQKCTWERYVKKLVILDLDTGIFAFPRKLHIPKVVKISQYAGSRWMSYSSS